MKVVALLSGGKDSCFNMLHCVANGHEIVALANLKPAAASGKDELDSYMYQTVGHDAIDLYGECMGLPLFRREIKGTSVSQGSDYCLTENDEVEDLFELLSNVKRAIPDVEGVSSGAILSNYQRVRVENVCARLGLASIAYMWRRNQNELMQEMISVGLNAILIKVASLGLNERHLGKTLQEMYPHLLSMHERFGAHICGEGGEFETLTLDCPIFRKRIVIDQTELVVHSDDAIAVVAYLRITKAHVEEKAPDEIGLDDEDKSFLLKGIGAYSHFSPDPCSVLPALEVDGKLLKAVEYHPIISCAEEETAIAAAWSQNRYDAPYFALSGLTVSDITTHSTPMAIEEETKIIMTEIHARLERQGLSWDNVVMMHVYIGDMQLFARLNSIYKSYFGINPPPRVTVEVALPGTAQVQIDCLAYRGQKETMHVQSISYWAPANIGPYSQTAMISDQIHTAGQIGLVPNTMVLPRPSDLSCAREARLSHQSLARVAEAVECNLASDAALCVCYLADSVHAGLSRAVWDQNVSTNVPALYVTVPGLPRNAQIEWAVLLNKPTASRVVDSSDEEDTSDLQETLKTASLKTDANEISCTADAWRRGHLSSIAGAAALIDSSAPLTQRSVVTLVTSLISQLKAATHKIHPASSSLGQFIAFRVFYLSGIPKVWIKTAFEMIPDLQRNTAVTFVPVSSIVSPSMAPHLHAALALAAHGSG
ncbi:hypothetical protein DFJ77DRAFT_447308 [Powellomyces hirtus]|nr:hypothetical protein DFJ77DRAFT_447308 [Powellomyces hirtus]